MPLLKMIYLSSDHRKRAVIERERDGGAGWLVKFWIVEPTTLARSGRYDSLDSAQQQARVWTGD